MAQSKAMELDLENEIEKTKKEGIVFAVFIVFGITLNDLVYENIGLTGKHLGLKQKILSKQLMDIKCILMTSLILLTKGNVIPCIVRCISVLSHLITSK